MAALLSGALRDVGQLHKTDDDLIDRLNHRFTVVLLVTFTAFVSAKQFIGEPISCWAPPRASGNQAAYTNSVCWLKGTYYLATDQRIIPHRTQNTEFHIAYYQFVPYMLLVMAMLFYLPHMLWRNISRHMGFDLRSMIQDIKQVVDRDIHQIAMRIHIALECNDSKYPMSQKSLQWSRVYRNRLSLLYMFIKTLYIINCFSQFYLLSIFLSFSFHKFGYEWLNITLTKIQTRINNQTIESKWFPRAVMCEFMIRQLGSNQHWIAVQCNLPINLFNELIFLIIWAWFIFLTSLTCASFLLCFISIYTKFGHSSIRKYLHMHSQKLDEENQDKFIEKYLSWDGVLVLRILSQNTNDIIMSKLIGELYLLHFRSKKTMCRSNDQSRSSEHYMPIDNSSI